MKTKAIIMVASIAALLFLQGMPAAADCMNISTDKTSYAIGEGVTITITNTFNEPILLNGYWIEDSDGNSIYFEPIPAFAQFLEPGESYDYLWTQVDDWGTCAAEGTYSAHFGKVHTTFEIVKISASITTEKPVYDVGETIIISVSNEYDYAICVPNGYCVLDENDNIVYSPNTLACMLTILPGESVQYIWDQIDNSGAQVDDGTYVICAANGQVEANIVAEEASAGNGNGHNITNPLIGGDFVPKPVTPGAKSKKMA